MKLVSGTRISIRKVSNGKTGLPFSEVPFCPEIFRWNEPKKHVPFTTQPEFPESLGKWKAPKAIMVAENIMTALELKELQLQVEGGI